MKYRHLVRYYGSLAEAARKLGIESRQTVFAWHQRDRIPSPWQVRIEKLTNGALKADAKATREVQEMVAHVNGNG